MIELAREIRQQLRAKPDKKTFRKTRSKLLEIAVALECACAALKMLEAEKAQSANIKTPAVEG